MEPLSRSSISARGVSVRCTGHRLRMVHAADTISTSFTCPIGPPSASSAILRRKLLNSFRIKKRSAVRPRQYCDRRRRGNTGCRTFPAGHPAPHSLVSPQAKRTRAGSASLPTRNDGRWSGSGLFTARGSCLPEHFSGVTPTQCFLLSHPGCRRPAAGCGGHTALGPQTGESRQCTRGAERCLQRSSGQWEEV